MRALDPCTSTGSDVGALRPPGRRGGEFLARVPRAALRMRGVRVPARRARPSERALLRRGAAR